MMSAHTNTVESLPCASDSALRELGADLTTARKRRKQSLRDWAIRLRVSVPTLVRMEKGDPTVGMGIYATALGVIGRQRALASLANPQDDRDALASDIRLANDRHRRREITPTSTTPPETPPSTKVNSFKTAAEMSANQADRELAEALRVQSMSGDDYVHWLQTTWGRLQDQGNDLYAGVPQTPDRRVRHFKTMLEKNRFDTDRATAFAVQVSMARQLQ